MAGYTEGPFKDQGGLILEGLEHLGPQPISGASAAQSSTIQTFDAFLKIVHIGNSNNFLLKQRNFMPVPHRKFIEVRRSCCGTSRFPQPPHPIGDFIHLHCEEGRHCEPRNRRNLVYALSERRSG
ncbi:hypothetical protein L596_011058 [Steinernema carpocapsae]|uniref:Uncharacterized protein n=1 Tax=Steinernema carpocapsae TaxID=34508 RepID=A0A4U5NSB1_STECR|nr:hypothetical protein L596_011058 [Steinernema carpocapsae]